MEMIRKEAGISEHALIESENFVPTAAGLASSASAYAALAGACNEALQLGLSDKDAFTISASWVWFSISQYLWWIC